MSADCGRCCHPWGEHERDGACPSLTAEEHDAHLDDLNA